MDWENPYITISDLCRMNPSGDASDSVSLYLCAINSNGDVSGAVSVEPAIDSTSSNRKKALSAELKITAPNLKS